MIIEEVSLLIKVTVGYNNNIQKCISVVEAEVMAAIKKIVVTICNSNNCDGGSGRNIINFVKK